MFNSNVFYFNISLLPMRTSSCIKGLLSEFLCLYANYAFAVSIVQNSFFFVKLCFRH